jgi:hypothetical protein
MFRNRGSHHVRKRIACFPLHSFMLARNRDRSETDGTIRHIATLAGLQGGGNPGA